MQTVCKVYLFSILMILFTRLDSTQLTCINKNSYAVTTTPSYPIVIISCSNNSDTMFAPCCEVTSTVTPSTPQPVSVPIRPCLWE